MKDPYISLIIPVYNVESYLRECLDSVCSQEYEKLEVLIVDDGSTDGSGHICDEYAHKDNRILLYHTDNGGLSAARNYALDRATGDYISFLDSDDWLEPDMINTLAYYAKEYDFDVLSFKYDIEWKDGREDIFADIKGSDEIKVYEGRDIVRAFIEEGRIGNCSWNKLYKKEMFSDVRFPAGEAYEDIGCLFKILDKAVKIICVPEYLYHYRKRRNSIGDIYSAKNINDYWNANYRRYNYLIDKYPELRYKLSENCIVAASRFWNCLYGSPENERNKVLPTMAEIKEFLSSHKKEVNRLSRSSGMIRLLRFFRWSTAPTFLKGLSVLYDMRKKNERERMYN